MVSVTTVVVVPLWTAIVDCRAMVLAIMTVVIENMIENLNGCGNDWLWLRLLCGRGGIVSVSVSARLSCRLLFQDPCDYATIRSA